MNSIDGSEHSEVSSAVAVVVYYIMRYIVFEGKTKVALKSCYGIVGEATLSHH